MAFKTITNEQSGSAITIKKGTKVEGYLVGFKAIDKTFGKGKNAEKRTNFIYQLRQASGQTVEVWGNGALNRVLLTENQKQLSPNVKLYLIRIIGGEKKKIKDRPMPMQTVEVQVDAEKRLKK